jgi:hypothetical protein
LYEKNPAAGYKKETVCRISPINVHSVIYERDICLGNMIGNCEELGYEVTSLREIPHILGVECEINPMWELGIVEP